VRWRPISVGLGRPGNLFEPSLGRPDGLKVWLRLGWFSKWRSRKDEAVSDLDRPTVPAPIGQRGSALARIGLVIDDSGSTSGTDPNGWRYVAARRVVNLLVDGLGGEPLPDEVAVVHFSDQPTPWLPLTSIATRVGRAAVRGSLRAVAGGGTSIVPAIDRAADLVGPMRADEEVIVILFTDGESGESTEELRAATARLPVGSMHVVVLGDRLRSQWQDVPVGSVTVITTLKTPADVEWVMARALYQALGLGWSGPDRPPEGADVITQAGEVRP
jgi:hypothetical protein